MRRRILAIILILVVVVLPIASLEVLTFLPPLDLSAVYVRVPAVQKQPGAFTPPPLPTVNWPVAFTDANYGRTQTDGGEARYDSSLKKAEAFSQGSNTYGFAEVGKQFISGGSAFTTFGFNGHISAYVATNNLVMVTVTFGVVVRDVTTNTEVYYGLIEKVQKVICTPYCFTDVNRDFYHGYSHIGLTTGHTYVAAVWVKAELSGVSSSTIGIFTGAMSVANAWTGHSGTAAALGPPLSRGITFTSIQIAPAPTTGPGTPK